MQSMSKNESNNVENVKNKQVKYFLAEIINGTAKKLHEASIDMQSFKGFKKFCSMYLMDNVLNQEEYDRYRCLMQTRNWRRNVQFDFYVTHANVTEYERREFAIVRDGTEAAELWNIK